ncbi:MAG: DNA polymerase II, partial [Gammaproteobacteria bacterium]
MDTSGFILQASYRVTGGVPVVHLYGRLENGETFLIRDRRARPHFYVPRAAEEAALGAGALAVAPVNRRTFGGEPVSRVELAIPQDAPGV